MSDDIAAAGAEPMVRVDLAGFRMELDPNEYIDRAILRDRAFEPQTTRWVEEHLGAGQTFLDVGANIGYFTLMAASRVGPGGTVLAIEPTTYGMARLQRNVAINEFRNVRVYKCALARELRRAVDITFEPSEYLTGSDNSIRSSWLNVDGAVGSSHAAARDFCDFVPLDHLCAVDGIDRIDFVKIDVDGHELAVIGGARSVLRAMRPRMILEVLDPGRAPGRYRTESGRRELAECVRFLFDLGYRWTAEDGATLTTPESLLGYLERFDGARGAPNFYLET